MKLFKRLLQLSKKKEICRNYASKAWHLLDYRGVDGLQCVDHSSLPIIKHPCDVIVRVKAASMNPLDVAMAEGYGQQVFDKLRQLDSSSADPLVTGRDFAGVVEAKGAAVADFNPGQEVFGYISPPFYGSHAQYTVASSSNVQLKPHNVSFEEAAAVPYAGLTAWSALRVTGELCENSKDKRVLVLGASGGVGTVAVQLLKLWGATVIGTCGTDAVSLVESLGADVVLDYKASDFDYNLQQLSGYDVILDSSGSADLEKVNLLKPWSNAKYITLSPPTLNNIDQYGFVGGMVKNAVDIVCSNVPALSKGRTMRWAFFMPNSTALQKIKDYMEKNKLRPVIDNVYKFENLPQAFDKMKHGHPRGKIVVSMSDLKTDFENAVH